MAGGSYTKINYGRSLTGFLGKMLIEITDRWS